MANIFYDRSGKPHVIGEKKKADQKEPAHKSKEKKEVARPGKGAAGSKNPWESKNPRDSKKEHSKEHKVRGSFQTGGAAPGVFTRDVSEFDKPRKGSVRGARSDRDRNDRGERPGRTGGAERGGPRRDSFAGKSSGGFNKRSGGGKSHRGKGGPGAGGRAGGKAKEFVGRARAPKTQNPAWSYLKGVIDKNKRGSAFLVFDRADLEDVFIPRFYVDQLFHGDRVEVGINPEGDIEDLKVLEHRFKEIFGRVHLEDRYEGKGKTKSKTQAGFLIYERKKAKEEVFIPAVDPHIKNGDWVKAEIVFSEDAKGRAAAPIAKILEVIGQELPAIYDIQMVAGEFNLKEHHSFDAVKQAEGYTLDVRPVGSDQKGVDEAGRTDLRYIPFMTIDGERARDFDDAVYVERTDNGYRLWVAIADVSHYVKKDTPLDREAFERGTSVYFPERAFHMLPRALSEELCSLKPKVPRLAMACSVDYLPDGTKGKIKIFNAIIESRRRATYTEIQAEKDDPKHAEMFELYRILRQTRSDRGSIDFDFPESEIILDEKTGEPTDVVIRERQDSNRLIEEFMISANESVTEWMLAQKLPFVYRVHDDPSPEAIEKFKKLARTMGVQLADKGGVPRPKVLAEFIRTLVGHVAEPVLANALLRSMRQAIYSGTFGEHYGLASAGYTHFTSPIRRYPDLVVHRLLRAALAKEPPAKEEELEQIAEHCSYRERVATEAERESIRFKQVRLMAKFIGKECDGKITGLSDRGFFVQLEKPYCEGMVPVDSMEDDWYEFNEERMVLVGRKKKATFTIGQKVKIQVARVDLDARQVEFKLIESEKNK